MPTKNCLWVPMPQLGLRQLCPSRFLYLAVVHLSAAPPETIALVFRSIVDSERFQAENSFRLRWALIASQNASDAVGEQERSGEIADLREAAVPGRPMIDEDLGRVHRSFMYGAKTMIQTTFYTGRIGRETMLRLDAYDISMALATGNCPGSNWYYQQAARQY